ncbi:glycosyl transferase family protein [Bradyrhizobium diazoefficiens]|nr:glycosyl transferase family protein [Bradyrhizobium diazoefficiens]MBR0775165.1 glycosyl transferase family protein [Bradyrhizobium diazoefficiens]
MNEVLISLFVLTSLMINLSSLDDIFIDLLSFGIAHLPLRRATAERGPLPNIAVFVANWCEEDVIGKMVEGNLARIDNPRVSLYLGVYPNDTGTRRVAEALAAAHPDRVRVIVNSLPGPTSKGQMLNEMFAQSFAGEQAPDLVVLHDSEDVIDARSFDIYAKYAGEFDFIQVPVFSLSRRRGAYVASTYMEEFAERHTRELIVRNALGAAIPSAGVGTCLTRALVRHFLETRGQVLMSGTVTEDYILGIEAKRAGFRSIFAATSAEADQGADYVATREFFPQHLEASIKQKTRWVYGIAFEAMHKLGWRGQPWDVYFFLRDRKGMITNFLAPGSIVLMILALTGFIDAETLPRGVYQLFQWSISFNLLAVACRYVARLTSSYRVYGRVEWLGVAIRWPVALYINMVATFRAWKIYLGESRFATSPIVWSKTTHDVPDDFLAATR